MTEEDKRPAIPRNVLANVLDEVRQTLQFMAESGCRGFDVSPETLAVLKELGREKKAEKPAPFRRISRPESVKPGPVPPMEKSVPASRPPAVPPRPSYPPQAQENPHRPPVSRPAPDNRNFQKNKPVNPHPARPQNLPPEWPPPEYFPEYEPDNDLMPDFDPFFQEPVHPPAPQLPSAPETLDRIRHDMGNCRRCKLCQGRTHIVFGEGHPRARLVFVGEGPGYDEDRSGRPFVGAAGQLLTRIITAMKLSREQVYICNIVKCRPPGNRNPEPDEIRTCLPFLERQLAAIRPEFVCTLGSVATRTLMDSPANVSSLRGRLHNWRGILLMPTFHPAFLLRNPARKREVWEDMKRLMAAMGIQE